jgi:hypothetical protein
MLQNKLNLIHLFNNYVMTILPALPCKLALIWIMMRLPATVGLGEICDIYIIIGELCHSFHIFYWDIQRLDWYSSCFRDYLRGLYRAVQSICSRYAENAQYWIQYRCMHEFFSHTEIPINISGIQESLILIL